MKDNSDNKFSKIKKGSVALMGHSLTCFPSGHERDVPKAQATLDKGSVARTHFWHD